MTTHWLLQVSSGENLRASFNFKIWGIQNITDKNGKYFINNVKTGDKLWFVKNKSEGQIIAVATYCSHNDRTRSNEELGWIHDGPKWISNIEINYNNLYNVSNLNLKSHIRGQSSIRKYNENCQVNLPEEYISIEKYSRITFEL